MPENSIASTSIRIEGNLEEQYGVECSVQIKEHGRMQDLFRIFSDADGKIVEVITTSAGGGRSTTISGPDHLGARHARFSTAERHPKFKFKFRKVPAEEMRVRGWSTVDPNPSHDVPASGRRQEQQHQQPGCTNGAGRPEVNYEEGAPITRGAHGWQRFAKTEAGPKNLANTFAHQKVSFRTADLKLGAGTPVVGPTA